MRPHRLDESRRAFAIVVENRSQRLFALDFDFTIRPARDFDDGVDDRGVILEWIQRDLRICEHLNERREQNSHFSQ